MVATLPDTPERARQELALQLAIGPVYMNVAGYGGADVARTFARARELSESLGDVPALLRLLYGLTVNEVIRAHHKSVRELCDQYLGLAEAHGDPSLLIPALRTVHWERAVRGELESAHAVAHRLLALHDPVRDAGHVAMYGQDLRVGSLAIGASFDWLYGYPDQAAEDARLVVSDAGKLSHPYSLALVTMWVTFVWTLRGDYRMADDLVRESGRLAREHGFSYLGTWTMILAGRSKADQGDVNQGVAEIRKGLQTLKANDTLLFYPLFSTFLATVLLQAGRVPEAHNALDEALTTMAATGEVFYEAEVYRLRGVVLQPEDEAAAERDFLHAIEIARGQQAKSLELRAAMSLARLWRVQGKTAEARELLAEVYGWFTEGFETRDLVEAKALLAELDG